MQGQAERSGNINKYLKDLKYVCDKLNKSVSIKTYDNYRKSIDKELYSARAIRTNIGSWNKAKQKIGYEPLQSYEKWNKKKVIYSFDKFVKKEGYIPSINDFLEKSYTPGNVYTYFNSFNDLVRAAGYEPKRRDYNSLKEYREPVIEPKDFCEYCTEKENCKYNFDLSKCEWYEGDKVG